MSSYLKTNLNNFSYINDTRNNSYLPKYYQDRGKGIIYEFKLASSIGISATYFCVLITITPWGDNTGGEVKQISISDYDVRIRKSNGNKWGSWGILYQF